MTGRFGELFLIFLIILLLFGAGRLPKIMGDLARGIRSFKSNIGEKDDGVVKDLDDKKEQ